MCFLVSLDPLTATSLHTALWYGSWAFPYSEWWERQKDRERRLRDWPRLKLLSFYNLISEVLSHHLWFVIFLRSESTRPKHPHEVIGDLVKNNFGDFECLIGVGEGTTENGEVYSSEGLGYLR